MFHASIGDRGWLWWSVFRNRPRGEVGYFLLFQPAQRRGRWGVEPHLDANFCPSSIRGASVHRPDGNRRDPQASLQRVLHTSFAVALVFRQLVYHGIYSGTPAAPDRIFSRVAPLIEATQPQVGAVPDLLSGASGAPLGLGQTACRSPMRQWVAFAPTSPLSRRVVSPLAPSRPSAASWHGSSTAGGRANVIPGEELQVLHAAGRPIGPWDTSRDGGHPAKASMAACQSRGTTTKTTAMTYTSHPGCSTITMLSVIEKAT